MRGLLPTDVMIEGRYRHHRAIDAYPETGIASSSITRSHPMVEQTPK